jgi:hypothetical protein
MKAILKSPILYLVVPITVFLIGHVHTLIVNHDEDAAAALLFALFLGWLAVPWGAGQKIDVKSACVWMSFVFAVFAALLLGLTLDAAHVFGKEIYLHSDEITALAFTLAVVVVYLIAYFAYIKLRRSNDRFMLQGKGETLSVALFPIITSMVIYLSLATIDDYKLSQMITLIEEQRETVNDELARADEVFNETYLSSFGEFIQDVQNEALGKGSDVFDSLVKKHLGDGDCELCYLIVFLDAKQKSQPYVPLWESYQDWYSDKARFYTISGDWSEYQSRNLKGLAEDMGIDLNIGDKSYSIQRTNNRFVNLYLYHRKLQDPRTNESWSFYLVVSQDDVVRLFQRHAGSGVSWVGQGEKDFKEIIYKNNDLKTLYSDGVGMDLYYARPLKINLYVNLLSELKYVGDELWITLHVSGLFRSYADYRLLKEDLMPIISATGFLVWMLLFQFFQYRRRK